MKFETAIERVLGQEGGYVNRADDPGGETNWGVSKRSYPELDIKNLSRAAAIEIYRRDFWDANRLDEFPAAVQFNMLDMAVNSGMGNATRTLQKALGVADDGHIGPITLDAARHSNPHDLASRFIAQRLRFMAKLKAWEGSGRGWANRIADMLYFSAEDID